MIVPRIRGKGVKETCKKQVKLKGLFTYTVRVARSDYTCFHCGKLIRAGTIYVEERFPGVTRRYHYRCFNQVVPHKLVAVETQLGVVLCTSQT
jgi:hypothetical protein